MDEWFVRLEIFVNLADRECEECDPTKFYDSESI